MSHLQNSFKILNRLNNFKKTTTESLSLVNSCGTIPFRKGSKETERLSTLAAVKSKMLDYNNRVN